MSLVSSVLFDNSSRTENDMRTNATSGSAVVDFFFAAGASRGKDISDKFFNAFVVDPATALKVLFWARDVREGAGERDVFRKIMLQLEKAYEEFPSEDYLFMLTLIIDQIPTYGRFDDLLIFTTPGPVQQAAFERIGRAFSNPNELGLVCKWMPRKGPIAAKLRSYFGVTPRQWRKYLVERTQVVETKMCAKDWDSIEFGKVPSLAAARYNKAFTRHTPKFAEYVESLKKGEAKVNVGAVYPYQVIKSIHDIEFNFNQTTADFIIQQWDALPNYVGDARILPIVDTSDSMNQSVGGTTQTKTTCQEVALSLGLYLSQKNTGPFHDRFITFSHRPEVQLLSGTIVERYNQLSTANWDGNTNLHAVFDLVLNSAREFNVPAHEMPDTLLILSDMEFDRCARYDDSAIQMIRRKYEQFGYKMPNIVFWNIQARSTSNIPVRMNDKGVALVSGFSPAIMKSMVSTKDLTPLSIVLNTVNVPRYAVVDTILNTVSK